MLAVTWLCTIIVAGLAIFIGHRIEPGVVGIALGFGMFAGAVGVFLMLIVALSATSSKWTTTPGDEHGGRDG